MRNRLCLAALSFAALSVVVVTRMSAATGTLADVQHVVILVQENRSFDHYFGCLKGVRGFNDPNRLIFPNGSAVYFQPQATGFILPYHCTNQFLSDVDHAETTTVLAWNRGKYNKWIAAKGSVSMAYFGGADLDFYYALAGEFTVCDAYHCSAFGPTWPNRLYLWTGMVDPNGTGGGPVLTNGVPPGGFTWTTYPERLSAGGITCRVYQPIGGNWINPLTWFAQYKNAPPGSPLWNIGRVVVPDVIGAFRADVLNGTLPKVAWIVSPWNDSEHPCQAPANGEFFVAQLLAALASNPAVYNSTVFILVYDENGGFFDHVPPPVPPSGVADEFVGGVPIGLGPRVPLILVSPWTRGGYVCSQVFDHTSIIQFLEKWTGVMEPNISAWRRQVCGDLTSAFDFQHPNTNYPNLPASLAPLMTCTNGFVPSVPSPQVMPAQEPGTLAARVLPYQPNAVSTIDCASGSIWITMTNLGSASMHFAIYANAYRSDGPWQYDVPAGGSVSDCFLLTNAASGYDLTCYGPNGFNRQFAGQLGTNCLGVDVLYSLDLDAGAVCLALQNPGTSLVTFTISNAFQPGSIESTSVPAGSTIVRSYSVTANNCWYDLTIGSTSDPSFLRRAAGHLELGTPALAASPLGGILLSYPAWASSYSLEVTTNLVSASWTSVGVEPFLVSNRFYVGLKTNSQAAFFRLRK